MSGAAAMMRRLRCGLERRGNSTPAWVLPTAIGLIALLLRLYGLGDKPFWLDEITTLHRATSSVHDLVLSALRHKHHPSYFLLLWLVARLGDSQWLLRLPSAIFGAIGASLASVIGTRAAGACSGAIAGLLMALSPFEVQFGQEARSYTLVSSLILLALWGFVRLAEEPEGAAVRFRESGVLRGSWLAYILGTTAAVSVLGVAIPWLLASNLAALLIASRDGKARRPFLRNWGLAQAFILSAWTPSLVALCLFNRGGIAPGAQWAPAATIATVWSTLAPVYLLRISDFITYDLAPAAVPGLSLVVAALAALGAWRLRRNPPVLTVLGCAALVLPVGFLLLSPIVPLLVPRYFAWGAAPFFIFAGAGLGQVSRTRFAALSASLAVACSANLFPYYGYETKPRWDLLAEQLAAAAQPGDVVLLDREYSHYVFLTFAKRTQLAEHGIKTARDLREAQNLASGHDVWAVYGRTGQSTILPPADYLRSLVPLGQPVAQYPIGRYIILYRFRALPARADAPTAA